MKLDYNIANMNIRFESERQISENGFAPRFSVQFKKPDFTYHIIPCNALPFEKANISVGAAHSKRRALGAEKRVVSHFLKNGGRAYMQVAYDFGNEIQVYIAEDDFAWAADTYYLLPAVTLNTPLSRCCTLVLHASFIEYKGRGLLFSGTSGVGKTTQAHLWRDFAGAAVINGDRVAVNCSNSAATVFSLPFAGTSGECQNKSLTLSTIVMLCKGESNKLFRLGAAEAFSALIKSTVFNNWDNDESAAVYAAVSELIGTTPIYRYECLPNESSVEFLKNELFR